MAIGLQCFDANGNVTFSETHYLPRIVGMVQTVWGVTDSLSLPIMSLPNFFYLHIPEMNGLGIEITLSNGTLTWKSFNGWIIYGLK